MPVDEYDGRAGEYGGFDFGAGKIPARRGLANGTDGEAWRVSAGEKYFGVPHPAAPKPTETSEVEPAKVDSARKTCQDAGINQVLALKDCTFDVSRTGNNAFVESARQFQEDVKVIPPAQLKGGDQRTAVVAAGCFC